MRQTRRKQTQGTAAIEAVLYTTFFLIPLIMLAWAVVHATASAHNALASVRHGAFTASVTGWKRYEHRFGGVHTVIPNAERDVRNHVAYYPSAPGQILSETTVFRQATVDMRATIRFNPPYAGPLRASRVDFVERLVMPGRNVQHFDEVGILKGRMMAKGPWVGLQSFLATLAGRAYTGPIPPI